MPHLELRPGDLAEAVAARLQRFAAEDVPGRLLSRDPTLWTDDPEHHAVAATRLGWLDLPRSMACRVDEVAGLAREAMEAGLSRAVVLGMGGSSLCVETFRRTLGVRPPGLTVDVVDTTDPRTASELAASLDPETTLAVVSSKSGTTVETLALLELVAERLPPEHLVAITDPSTPLAVRARSEGYRACFLNPPDVGGRFSALSFVGLVPLALLGHDVAALLSHAADLLDRCTDTSRGGHPAVTLGALLGEAALAGRDKLALVPSPPLDGLGPWIEQLVAESSGKAERGIVPLVGDRAAAAPQAPADRVHLRTLLDGHERDEADAGLDALADAGHPVASLVVPSVEHVGATMLLWEMATAIACHVLGVDAFDQPDVQAAKEITRDVLRRHAESGELPVETPLAATGDLAVSGDAGLCVAREASVAEALRAHLVRLREGDYFALLAYLPELPAVDGLLRAATAAVAASGVATTLGYGPRYLHSTGQLHKGGPPSGLYLLVTREAEKDEPIPGTGHGFATLQAAQALGDLEALRRRGRRVARCHVRGDLERGLADLRDALAAAAGDLPR